MLVAVKLCALAHLLANGDLGGVLLFGAFLAWAMFDRIAVKKRGDLGAPHIAAFTRADIQALGLGTLAFVTMIFLHPYLIGVSVLGCFFSAGRKKLLNCGRERTTKAKMDHNRDYLAEDPATIPLEDLDPGQPILFQNDAFWPHFARLRREDPVHYSPSGMYGPYWSITKYKHIMQIEANHEVFSSDVKYGGIAIRDQLLDFTLPMFIAMDPPKHDHQRAAVEPIVSKQSLADLEILIRSRAQTVLDNLPINQTFNWVDRVSIELTTQLLATMLDFPWEDRRKLTRWSDVATAVPGAGIIATDDERKAELLECLNYFMVLWNQRVNAPPKGDLISLMAHNEATRHQGPMELLGNLLLLIIGGNDTTRNSITGGLYALNKFPDEYEKLLANPGLVPNMVPEIIRWQTPLAHMRRTATRDFEFEGKKIHAGDKVVLWYVSGNYDEDVIPNAARLLIDRERPRRHLSFGFGMHRCLGERLADLQLRIVWEEILLRFGRIEVVEEPKRIFSAFVKGYSELLVRIPPEAVRN